MTNEPAREVISLLGASVDTVAALRWRNDFFPEGGSRAHLAWASSKMPAGSGEFFGYERAAIQLGAAEDQILALEVLLQDGTSSIAPFVLARGAIEASGRAFGLMDPVLAADARTELALAEKLHELHTLERLMRAHDPLGTDAQVRTDLSEVRQRIRALKTAAGKEGLTIAPRPGFSDVVSDVMASGDNDHLGRITAIKYSSLAHAVPEMLLALTSEMDPSLGHLWGVGWPELDEGAIIGLVLAVLVAYMNAVSRQVDAFGWPPSAWTRWRGHVRAALRRELRTRERGLSRT